MQSGRLFDGTVEQTTSTGHKVLEVTPTGSAMTVGVPRTATLVQNVNIASRKLKVGNLELEHWMDGAYATVKSDNVVQVQAPLMPSGGIRGGLNVTNGDLILDRPDGSRALLRLGRTVVDPDTGATLPKGFTFQTFAPGVGLNAEILIIKPDSTTNFGKVISFDGANARLGVNRYGAEETLDVSGNSLVRGGIRVDNWNTISAPQVSGTPDTSMTAGERIKLGTANSGEYAYSIGLGPAEIWTSVSQGAKVGTWVGGTRRFAVNSARAEFADDVWVNGDLRVEGNSAFDMGQSLNAAWPTASGYSPFVGTTARSSAAEVLDKLQPVMRATFPGDGCGIMFDVTMTASAMNCSAVYNWRFARSTMSERTYRLVVPTHAADQDPDSEWELLVRNVDWRVMEVALKWKRIGKHTHRAPFVKLTARAVQAGGTNPSGCTITDLTATAATTDATTYVPYFSDGATKSGAVSVLSRAWAQATSFSSWVSTVLVQCYATPGDGGAARYTRHTPVTGHATENMAWAFQSADGAWWILDVPAVRPEMLGADGKFLSGPGVDDTAALNAAFYAHLYLMKPLYVDGAYRCSSQLTWINDKFGTKYPWMGEGYMARVCVRGRARNAYLKFDTGVASPCMQIGGGSGGWMYDGSVTQLSITASCATAGHVILKLGGTMCQRSVFEDIMVVNAVDSAATTNIEATGLTECDLKLYAETWQRTWRPTVGSTALSLENCSRSKFLVAAKFMTTGVRFGTGNYANNFVGSFFDSNTESVTSASASNSDNTFAMCSFNNNGNSVRSTASTRLTFRDCWHVNTSVSVIASLNATDSTYGGVGVFVAGPQELVGRSRPQDAATAVAVPASGGWVHNRWRQPARVSILGSGVTSVSVRRMSSTDATVFTAPVEVANGPTIVTLAPDESISISYTTAPTWRWDSAL